MEWMCAECGAPHERDDPPCDNCGAMQFEKAVVRERPDDELDTASVEWECTECGRTTPKNNPPCSRCGSMQFESVDANQFDESELDVGYGLRDVAKVVGVLALVGVAVVAALNAGVLDQSPPSVEDVPGDANTSSGLDLDTVEYEIYEDINEKRLNEGTESLSLEQDTSNIAEYYNKMMVKRNQYPLETDSSEIFEKFGRCPSPEIAVWRLDYERDTENRAIDYYRTESALAQEITEGWFESAEYGDRLLDESATSAGVDVHVAEDGSIYTTVTYC